MLKYDHILQAVWFINSLELSPTFIFLSLLLSSIHPASHYSSMLEKEGLTELLKALAAHPSTHSDIKGLSDSILSMVEQHQIHAGAFNNQTEPQSS